MKEGVEESLRSIKASEKFIEELTKSSTFNDYIVYNKMEEFYVGYDVDKIIKGKSAWTWSNYKKIYSVNWNFKGEVHPNRKDKITELKKLWKENE
jgi:hypothetical protein